MAYDTYLEVLVLKGSVAPELQARLVTAVHFCNNKGSDMAISFPNFKTNFSNQFGYNFRVFGSTADLTKFIARVQPLETAGLIQTEAIAKVPETTETVVFKRDRKREGMTASHIRRLVRRAAARGEAKTFDIQPTDTPSHSLQMQSKTTDAPYTLYITKSDTPTEGGRAFGLGIAVPAF